MSLAALSMGVLLSQLHEHSHHQCRHALDVSAGAWQACEPRNVTVAPPRSACRENCDNCRSSTDIDNEPPPPLTRCFVPSQCPDPSIDDVFECVRRRTVKAGLPSPQSPRIVFLGDSVTMQIFFSIACKLNVRFRHVEAVPGRTGVNAEPTAHWIGTTYESIDQQTWPVRSTPGKAASAYLFEAIDLKEYRRKAWRRAKEFASPIVKSLLQDAFYVVNFGLWHAVC